MPVTTKVLTCMSCGSPLESEDHDCVYELGKRLDVVQVVIADLCKRHGPWGTGQVLERELKDRRYH